MLALRELEDRSYAEIGVIVGLKENAVAQLISRARENLRTELRLAQVDPSRLPEECRRLLPLLSRHLDGQLRGSQLEETLAHLDGCERCQDALLAMREAKRRYRVLLPPFGDDDEHRERIEAELTSAGYWSGGPRGSASAAAVHSWPRPSRCSSPVPAASEPPCSSRTVRPAGGRVTHVRRRRPRAAAHTTEEGKRTVSTRRRPTTTSTAKATRRSPRRR